MLSKRQFMRSFAAGLGAICLPRAASAQEDSFSKLYASAVSDTGLEDVARADTADKLSDFETRAVAPRGAVSALPISEDAFKLIVLFEVTSAALYDQRYQKPVWPGGDSGVTIGVGYDMGYVTPAWFEQDWGGRLAPAQIARLRPACGKRGPAAQALYRQYADVAVPWRLANPQFREKLIPLYTGLAISKLPAAARTLSPDCLGALVSLVYNRGASFRSEKPRFREMRRIHGHLEDGELDRIPDEFLAMRRLWEGNPKMRGLVKRRELEAALFRQGLERSA